MNYQHYYHAGNAADVFKHIVLLALLTQFTQKDKAFCYVDLYAGAGSYDLTDSANKEWQAGVGKIRHATVQHPVLKAYQKRVVSLRAYAGSPLLARQSLRAQDELIAVEKEAAAFTDLKNFFYRDKQVHVHLSAAENAIKALLPPKIRRGIVLFDPPYEAAGEFAALPGLLEQALQRWATATYLIWYPIKVRALIQRFHQQLQRKITQNMLALELCPWPDDVPVRLNGSGLIVLNPPWQFTQTVQPLMIELLGLLKQDVNAQQKIIYLK